MNKKLLIPLVGLAASALLVGPILLGLVAVLFGAAASANPCISPVGILGEAGGPVRLPVVGGFTVTSEFGMRYNPGDINTGQYRMHWGLDLSEVPAPTAAVAAKAGVVKALPTDLLGGNQVEIDHGGGLVTVYMHLTSRSVQLGETVWAGKQIGVEGTTGNSSGPHVHFQVELNGQPTNPRDWLVSQGVPLPPPRGRGVAPAVVSTPPAAGTDVPPVSEPSPVNPTGTPGGTKPVTTTLPAQVGRYHGDQVLNAAYVIKAGQAMSLDAKSITIGVMTAMGESSLVSVDHGDNVGPDSRGLFQQRGNGAWGSYSDRMNPTIASTNFFKALVAVPGYLGLEPTIAAHRVQRNADPYHYAPMWPDAVLMVSTLTKDPTLLQALPVTGPITGCENGGPEAPPSTGGGSGAAIVSAAIHYLGTPYSWGGGDIHGPSLGIYSSPSLDGTHTVGFDCSGLVLFAVHNATGIQLAHGAEIQGKDSRGTVVPRDWGQMQPGDVISFSEDGSGSPGSFGHVGIYVGDGKMIHAPRPGKSVEVVQLKGAAYFESMAWSIRRYANRPL